MNKWGIPDWQDALGYGDMSSWTHQRWRWEFMRRQPDLRAYFDERAEEAFKARAELANDPACNPNFVAEMNCAINDPRFTLLEDKVSKSRFGYLRLHNPRISEVIPSQFLVNCNDDAITIADPGFMQRTLRLEDWQIGVAFDLTRPIEPQLEAATSYLKHMDAAVRDNIVIRRKRPDTLPQYLRVLDGREYGASWATIGRTLYPNHAGDQKDKARTAYDHAQGVVSKLRSFNPPPL